MKQDTPTQEKQHCVAYCQAGAYALHALSDSFKAKYKTSSFRNVLHIEIEENKKDAFCFAYGVTVFWGLEKKEEKHFLQQFKDFEREPRELTEKESMTFAFCCEDQKATIVEEEIIIPGRALLSKLALSHGLAQSAKLSTFEETIQATINATKYIPQQLASKGHVPLSKKEIRKKMGALFLERSSINLHLDILDVPELFWEHSELEPLYMMIANHLELESRVEVLNQRLDIVHDLFEMLGNELNHQHSSKLEWIIIWLIVIEVIITLGFHYGG